MYHDYDKENEELRSLKQGDSYSFQYTYEYVANRYGEGDDDVDLENATVNVTVSWDDSSAPGYTVSYYVDAPTPIPNLPFVGDASDIFNDIRHLLVDDLCSLEIGPDLYKDW